MDLIYYYSPLNDAPGKVSKEILKQLIDQKEKLPFDEVKLFVSDKNKCGDIGDSISKLNIITFSELIDYEKKYIVHIPISPFLYPNKKLLLNLFCKVKKKPLVLHYHGDFRETLKSRLKYERCLDIVIIPSALLIPYMLKSATKVVIHSYMLKQIVKNKYNVENNIMIPNGLEDYWFQPLEGKPLKQINKKYLNIFYHGRLAPEKGVDILIDAVGEYIKINPNITLYIAGDGSLNEYLYEKCSKYNISESVVFLGNVDKQTIKFYLENVDAAIYPSRFDAFCLAVLEALASANCPVYFSINAGIYDFVKKDGFELNCFEPSKENILNIINSIDSGFCMELIEKQKQFTKKYRWSKIIDEYINLYQSILNEG